MGRSPHQKVDTVLTRPEEAGLKVNGLKSFFGRSELEHLGCMLTQQGVKPLKKKVDAMLKIAPPKTIKQLRSFLGCVNYYRDVWIQRAHLFAPLNHLMKKGPNGIGTLNKPKPLTTSKQ